MKILDSKFVRGFIKMADDGFHQGWHERNGGNLSYRLKPSEVEEIRPRLMFPEKFLFEKPAFHIDDDVEK